jgi:hypothetical protein
MLQKRKLFVHSWFTLHIHMETSTAGYACAAAVAACASPANEACLQPFVGVVVDAITLAQPAGRPA